MSIMATDPSGTMAGEEMDTQRDYEDVLRLQIAEGVSELERPPAGQFLSALSCGLTLGLGVFALFLMRTLAAGSSALLFLDFLSRSATPLGSSSSS